MHTRLHTALVIATAGLAAISISAQSPPSAEVALRSAQYQERIRGDVAGAIATYLELAAGIDRTVAAQALLALADAYERTANPAARDTLVRLDREFSDMPAAASARRRLDAQRGPVQRALLTGKAANQVWSAVSPDGRYLPFSDPQSGNLAIRDLTTGKTSLITKSKGYEEGFVEAAVWSNDGRQLAYSWWHEEPGKPSAMQLRIVARDNGTPKVLYSKADLGWMQPLAWSPDGSSILAVIDADGPVQIGLVSASTGSLKSLKIGVNPTRAAFSPDGRYIAYDYSASVPMRDINIIGTDGTNDRPLVTSPDDDFLMGWAPDGRHILFGSDRLNTPGAWRLAIANGRAEGSPQLVKADIGRTESLGFDRKGRLYTVQSVGGDDVFVAEIDPATGKMTAQARPAAKAPPLARRSQATWSPDGRQLIYTQNVPGRGTSLVVQTVATGELNIRPTALGNIFRPFWFPDGAAVALRASSGERFGQGIFKVDLRSGAVSPILVPAQNFVSMSRDGELIYYTRGQSILRRRTAGGAEEEVGTGYGGTSVISNDGRSLARFRGAAVVVKPTTSAAERVLVESVPGGNRRITWSPDDQYIFFASSDREIWRVPAAGGPAIDTGVRTELPRLLSVNPDGRRLAISGGETQAEVWVWENVVPER